MSDLLENHISGPERVSIEDSPAGVKAENPTEPPEEYEDMQALLAGEAGGFRTLRRHQTLKGTVVSVDAESVLVHIGTKSEGIIPRDELAEEGEDLPELRYEQEILVQVVEPDSPRGPILSLKRARREQSWVDMEEYARSGGTISAVVVDHNRGGALLDARGLRGFVPLSQLVSLGPAGQNLEGGDDTQERLGQLHGQRLVVKVLEAERNQNRLILSERAAADEVKAQKRTELLADLKPGQIRHGQVRNVTNFGAFIDLGGADGLVHVSELSYERVQDPRRILQPGQEVDVYVMDVRPEDQKISLSLKRAMADPWESVAERYQPGQVVDAYITRLMKFGAFAQVEPGIEGLIHVTELADNTPKDPGQVVQSGQQVQTKIIHIDQPGRRLGLSLRQLRPADTQSEMTPDQWHVEQERQSGGRTSSFDALSALAHTLAESQAERPEASSPPASREVELEGRGLVERDTEDMTDATPTSEVIGDAVGADTVVASPEQRVGRAFEGEPTAQAASDALAEDGRARKPAAATQALTGSSAAEVEEVPAANVGVTIEPEIVAQDGTAVTGVDTGGEPVVEQTVPPNADAKALPQKKSAEAKKRVRKGKRSDKPDPDGTTSPAECIQHVPGTAEASTMGMDDTSANDVALPLAEGRAPDEPAASEQEKLAESSEMPEASNAVPQSV